MLDDNDPLWDSSAYSGPHDEFFISDKKSLEGLLKQAGVTLDGKEVLEVGGGSDPKTALLLALGAQNVTCLEPIDFERPDSSSDRVQHIPGRLPIPTRYLAEVGKSTVSTNLKKYPVICAFRPLFTTHDLYSDKKTVTPDQETETRFERMKNYVQQIVKRLPKDGVFLLTMDEQDKHSNNMGTALKLCFDKLTQLEYADKNDGLLFTGGLNNRVFICQKPKERFLNPPDPAPGPAL